MAENGILKIGKATAFQAHMIEHQLGAYTDCNHGFGLAVIHPTMYRHMVEGAPEQLRASPARCGAWTRRARAISRWRVPASMHSRPTSPRSACRGRSPTWASRARGADEMLRAVADSTIIITSAPKVLDANEIYEILEACK